MFDFLRKNRRTIYLITLIGFVAGIFVGFGGYAIYRTYDAVAIVNNVKIPYSRYQYYFSQTLENYRDQGKEFTENVYQQMKREVLSELIQEEVFWQEAKKFAIKVPDKELAYTIQQYPAFQRDGKFDPHLYYQILHYRLRTTPMEFELSRRKSIAIAKLRRLIMSLAKISPFELEYEYRRRFPAKIGDFDKEKDKFLEELTNERITAIISEWYNMLNRQIQVKEYLSRIEREVAR
jgi:hypothetical protein